MKEKRKVRQQKKTNKKSENKEEKRGGRTRKINYFLLENKIYIFILLFDYDS